MIGDSLQHVWDEVCAQVQGEEPVFWNLYQDAVEQVIRFEANKLVARDLEGLWFLTESGMDWLNDSSGPDVPVNIDDIVAMLEAEVHDRAAKRRNRRIDAANEREHD
jgi:hypothetical protein